MAATGHGATFIFASNRGSINGGVTKITVDAPTAEVADVTGLYDGGGIGLRVPTGAWRDGSITVDFIAGPSLADIQPYVRGFGSLTFSSVGYSVSRQVILESGSTSAAVGDVVRGTLKFVMTDWYG